eukprot:GSA120T00024482001.1
MAKSKNHTNHNQGRKAHRNGIKKTRTPKKMSTKGISSCATSVTARWVCTRSASRSNCGAF